MPPREVNRRVLESLAKAGALDELVDRSAIVGGISRVLTVAQEAQRQRDTGQTSMFDLFGDQIDTPLPALELEPVQTPQRELLLWERELLGTYISEHPFQLAARHVEPYISAQAIELTADLAGQQAVVAGTVMSVRRLMTRQGKPFAAVRIEDLSGSVELTMWPDAYERHEQILVNGNVLLALVEVRERGDRLTCAIEQVVVCDTESGLPTGFNPARFQPGPARPRRRPPQAGFNGQQNGNGRSTGTSATNGATRTAPRLHAVSDTTEASERPSNEGPPPAERVTGPPRLLIRLEETQDAPADRRRIERIFGLLTTCPGDDLVELEVLMRTGQTEILRLPATANAGQLTSELRGVLGVLGTAEHVGDIETPALENASTG
jgi:DNA polymerase-3 subunit alpha